MFTTHSSDVMADYKKRRNEKSLSSNLLDPTPAGLRDECLLVYEEKGFPIEDAALRSFFGPLGVDEANYFKRIENFDIDKFRPVVNFLNGATNNPSRRVVELVLWIMVSVKETTGQAKSSQLNIAISPLLVAVSCIVVLLSAQAINLLWNSYLNTPGSATVNEKCMYWTGRHYETVDCETAKARTAVIPINLERLKNLKKITLPDTLTKSSLGKVWYSGRGKDHEFFTDSGKHPVDSTKRLHPLTDYILNIHTSRYRYLLIRLICAIGIVLVTLFVIIFFDSMRNFLRKLTNRLL